MTPRPGARPYGRWMLIAVAVAALYALYSWITAPLTIADAIAARTVASDSVFGGAGALSTITVTRGSGSSGSLAIAIPAGTVLYSGDPSAQRLITAGPVAIVMPAAANTASVQVKTFCVDEFAAVPSVNTALSFTAQTGERRASTEETEPLHKLAACMADSSQPDADKQVAVWAVKDDLLHKSPAEALEFLTRGFDEQLGKIFHDKVARERESILRESLHLNATEVDAEIADHVREEDAKNHTEAQRLARQQLDNLLQHDRDLLTSCGHDAASMPLFR